MFPHTLLAMSPKASIVCLALSLLVAGAFGFRDPLTALERKFEDRVPRPFIVDGSIPTSAVYFHDAKFAGYNVSCVAPGGAKNFSFVLSTKDDSPGSTSDVVYYGISTPTAGEYACEFSKSGGGEKRSVKIRVPEEGAVPAAPSLSLSEVRTPETVVCFPDVEGAAEYRARCRTSGGLRVATDVLELGADATSDVALTVETEKPGRYSCVVYAKNARGEDGGKAFVEFDVRA